MVMGLVYTSMLFMVVPIIGVMDALDDSLIEAAYDTQLGAAADAQRVAARTALSRMLASVEIIT